MNMADIFFIRTSPVKFISAGFGDYLNLKVSWWKFFIYCRFERYAPFEFGNKSPLTPL
jgi:hypothetical protein